MDEPQPVPVVEANLENEAKPTPELDVVPARNPTVPGEIPTSAGEPVATNPSGNRAAVEAERSDEGVVDDDAPAPSFPDKEASTSEDDVLSEGEGECRICGETCALTTLVEPCECRGGMRYAHHECVQMWISTERGDGRRKEACEVCGVEWRGEFNVPHARPLPTPEESMRRVHMLLSAAYIRVMMDIPRTNDQHILRTLGPHVRGPWIEYLRREEAKKRTVYYRVKATIRRMVASIGAGGDARVSAATRHHALRRAARGGVADGAHGRGMGDSPPVVTDDSVAEALALQTEGGFEDESGSTSRGRQNSSEERAGARNVGARNGRTGSTHTGAPPVRGDAGRILDSDSSNHDSERLERPVNPGCFPAFMWRRRAGRA